MVTEFVKFQKFEKIEKVANRKLNAAIRELYADAKELLKEEGLEGPFIDNQGRPLQFNQIYRNDIDGETEIVLTVFDPAKPHIMTWEPVKWRLVDFVIAFERGEIKNLNA